MENTPSEKPCLSCGETKPLTHFDLHKSSKYGRRGRCKECRSKEEREKKLDPLYREKQKQYQADHYRKRIEKNPMYLREVKNYREKPNGRAHQLIYHAKRRALAKGWDFSVSLEKVRTSIENGRCAVTGIAFDLKSSGDYHFNAFAPSLDRIDSTKGYTDDNVQIVVWAYNVGKSQMSTDDYHAFLLSAALAISSG